MAHPFTPYLPYAARTLEQLGSGLFLTTGTLERPNTMTIGWGTVGIIWYQPIFTVLVRFSRYTRVLIERDNRFTISVPTSDAFKTALGLCGTKSGRDLDKFSAAGLTAQPGRTGSVPVVAGCSIHYECEVVNKQTLDPVSLDASVTAAAYRDGDFHTVYYGKILDCYEE